MLSGILFSCGWVLLDYLLRGVLGALLFRVCLPIVRLWHGKGIQRMGKARVTLALYMSSSLAILGIPIYSLVQAFLSSHPSWQRGLIIVLLLYLALSVIAIVMSYPYKPFKRGKNVGFILRDPVYATKTGIATHSDIAPGTSLTLKHPQSGISIQVQVVARHPTVDKEKSSVGISPAAAQQLGFSKEPFVIYISTN